MSSFDSFVSGGTQGSVVLSRVNALLSTRIRSRSRSFAELRTATLTPSSSLLGDPAGRLAFFRLRPIAASVPGSPVASSLSTALGLSFGYCKNTGCCIGTKVCSTNDDTQLLLLDCLRRTTDILVTCVGCQRRMLHGYDNVAGNYKATHPSEMSVNHDVVPSTSPPELFVHVRPPDLLTTLAGLSAGLRGHRSLDGRSIRCTLRRTAWTCVSVTLFRVLLSRETRRQSTLALPPSPRHSQSLPSSRGCACSVID